MISEARVKELNQCIRENGIRLEIKDDRLLLTDGKLVLAGDFSVMIPRLKQSNLEKELLVKAVRIPGDESPRLIDATAGMGEDALLLAAAGCQVTMYEKNPVIAELLRDALRRADRVKEIRDAVSRLTLVEEDSIAALMRYPPVQVVCLDPMFPERTKSALVKKKFQLLHQLAKPCENERELFEAAVAAHPKKIVVKRPLKGPCLAEKKPTYSLTGKAIRYDCYQLT